jgi:hypothetical protein
MGADNTTLNKINETENGDITDQSNLDKIDKAFDQIDSKAQEIFYLNREIC